MMNVILKFWYIYNKIHKNIYVLFLHPNIRITLYLDYDKNRYATMIGYDTRVELGLARHWVLTRFTMILFNPAPWSGPPVIFPGSPSVLLRGRKGARNVRGWWLVLRYCGPPRQRKTYGGAGYCTCEDTSSSSRNTTRLVVWFCHKILRLGEAPWLHWYILPAYWYH